MLQVNYFQNQNQRGVYAMIQDLNVVNTAINLIFGMKIQNPQSIKNLNPKLFLDFL